MITLTAKDTLVIEEHRNLGIYNFGIDNLYPNWSVNFAENSPSLHAALCVYERFIFGDGMTHSKDFWKRKINIYGLRVDQFLRRIVRSYAIHRGFAFKVLWNGAGEITGIVPVKFENCRLGKADDNGVVKKIRYCNDWSKKRLYDQKDILEYDVYNDDIEIIHRQAELAGGWDNYKGQIFYWGDNGELKYPHNSFHSVLEDCATDIGIKNGKNANVSTNFVASHMMELPFTFQEIADELNAKVPEGGRKVDPDQLREDYKKQMTSFQSNENVGKFMLVENTKTDNEGKQIPIKVEKFELQNYDKMNEYTEKSVKENIRQNYNIPPILLQETATGFSTEIFKHAYNYFNELTKYDRQIFEETFIEIFENWVNDVQHDLSIKQLEANVADV